MSARISTITSVAFQVLCIVGLWKVFEKSGVDGFWAIIPFAREYHIGVCADRTGEAVKEIIFSVIAWVLGTLSAIGLLILFVVSVSANADMGVGAAVFFGITTLGTVVCLIISLVFRIKVFQGLCDAYGQTRWWILIWFFFQWLAAMIWGFSDSYQPLGFAPEGTGGAPESSGNGQENWQEGTAGGDAAPDPSGGTQDSFENSQDNWQE